MLNLDPLRHSRLVEKDGAGSDPAPGAQGDSQNPGGFSAKAPTRDVSGDLALDLRLHGILEQACLATAAAGAVIALAAGDEMVCRATFGEKAPAVGVSLNTRSGLSGACIRTRELQRCDDAFTDLRVNANACRDLEIRSILVLPVIIGETLCGIFEIFSPIPCAFGDGDIQALTALSNRISQTVGEASSTEQPALEATTQAGPTRFVESEPVPVRAEVVAREMFRAAESQPAPRKRDYWTSVLTAGVICLAVLLGWMVGRAGWSMAVNRAQAQLPAVPDEVQAATQVTPPAVTAPVPATSARAVQTEPRDKQPQAKQPANPVPKAKSATAEPPAGGLVVYEQGKVVFRMPPADKQAGAADSGAASGAENKSASVEVSPQKNSSYLVERVEPEYPEEARLQRIQGPVVLSALVGANGSVRDVSVISGDPHLTQAAVDAVRQWRFKPHLVRGKPVDFETQITVNFALP